MSDEDELAVAPLHSALEQVRRGGSRVAAMQKQASPAWLPHGGVAPPTELGSNIRQKISQWEGRSQPAAVGKPRPPAFTRALSADLLGRGGGGSGAGAGGGGGAGGDDALRDPSQKATLCKTKSLALDFRETQEATGLKPVGRRSEPFQRDSPGISTSVPDKRLSLSPALRSSPKGVPQTTAPSGKQATAPAEDFRYTPSRPVPQPQPEHPPRDDPDPDDDNMPAGNFYTSRGFWRRLEGNKLLWEKGLGPPETPQPPPKPLRTFQYLETRGGAAAPGQGVSDSRGGRIIARPPDFPPPPCPGDRTNGLSRYNKNRKSFEYEDASHITVKQGMLGDEEGLYHAYSDDNIYEDIISEGPRESPYEDVKLSPMCLPLGRARPRPSTLSQRDNQRGPKASSKPHTLRDHPPRPNRKGSQQTLPPNVSALLDTPKPAGPRRSATQRVPRQPPTQAQYISKIETIFDAKRGRKRVKNQGNAVREETSGTESDPEDPKDSRRTVYVQSTLRRRPGYRTLERDLIQNQQQQLFQIFVVVSLRKGSSGNTYSPEITQQFPKMFEKPSRHTKEAEDRLKAIPRFCFPDALDWKPSSDMTSETFSFVLTGEDGSRWFCYCRKILPSGKGKRLPEVHCMVSQLGCFNLFAKILVEVERRREICPALVHPFMRSVMEAPFPAPGRTITVKSFLPGSGNEVLTLCRPVDSRLEHVDFRTLLQCLSVERLLQVFSSLLLERRVIFIADKLGVLSRCSHAVLALLYPFIWQHTFVPVLPASMLDISCSPTPFLMGALAPCLPQLLELPIEEVLIVDLCANKFVVQLGDEDCILPSKLQAALQQVLEERELILGQEAEQEGASPGDRSEQLSALVSEAFVRLFVELVGHYPLHMAEASSGTCELQRDAFRKSHPSRGVRQFLQLFMETQMFAGFIQDKELRKGGGGAGKGLFEARAAEYLESYPEPTGVNRFLKGLGSKMKFLQMK
ncbi:DENN domain-containing protein 2C [Gadus chalcogrammus]|uniref:DENN domain-containing protein 2C n=1 Tax=Gadus chalcogrammus TaxID=1042646 RepID=UPI0024C3BAE1|nr:DENN domain-containing protein 2C [Gadus chalcogrammus]